MISVKPPTDIKLYSETGPFASGTYQKVHQNSKCRKKSTIYGNTNTPSTPFLSNENNEGVKTMPKNERHSAVRKFLTVVMSHNADYVIIESVGI